MLESPTERQILSLISIRGGVSRKDLAEATGLSQATLTNVTKHLMEKGFIVEGGRVNRGPGRSEVLLMSNPEKFRFLAVDIGGYYIRIALADNNLRILQRTICLTEEFGDDKVEHLVGEIEKALASWGVGARTIDAAGVTVTGIVDPTNGVILNIPNSEGWDNIPVVSGLSTHFGWAVFLEEGGRAMALAEHTVGKAKSYNDFIVVQVGFGLVAGIMCNGQLVRGANNIGGLLGHVTADERTGRCTCGNYGCLENTITFPMLEKAFTERTGRPGKTLTEAYAKNDKTALDVLMEAGKALGIALSNVVNLFNPEIVFLGGNVFTDFPILVEETKRTIILRANRFATLSFRLEPTSFEDAEGILGSLAIAKSRLMFS